MIGNGAYASLSTLVLEITRLQLRVGAYDTLLVDDVVEKWLIISIVLISIFCFEFALANLLVELGQYQLLSIDLFDYFRRLDSELGVDEAFASLQFSQFLVHRFGLGYLAAVEAVEAKNVRISTGLYEPFDYLRG